MNGFVDLLVFASIVAVLYWIVTRASKKKGKDFNILKEIGIPLVVVGLVVFGIFQCARESEPITLSLEEQAYYTSQNRVKEFLKSPSTAQFPYYPSSDILIVTMPHDENIYAVKSWVDAKNAFGVPIRMNYLIHLKHMETYWRLESLQIDGEKVY